MSAARYTGEHVSVSDPKDPTWRWQFDLTFFMSAYTCIWGQGCPSIEGDGSNRGCCTHGVYIVDGADHKEGRRDLRKVRKQVRKLTDADWQNKPLVDARGGVEEESSWLKARDKGSVHTRVHNGACIFHNREGFAGGAGCALHVAAMRHGENYIDWKPLSCWMVPLRHSTDEVERIHRIEPYFHHNWGDGDEPNKWWCIDAPEAYVGEEAAFRTMEPVLRKLAGDEVYETFAKICKKRMKGRKLKPLPMYTPVRFIGVEDLVEGPDGSTGLPPKRS
jgi:hypothetical protein